MRGSTTLKSGTSPLILIDGVPGELNSVSPNDREGNDYPRMAETPQGMLNCVGLQNKGVQYFCSHIYPQIKDIDTNMIVNVSGHSPESYAECAARINDNSYFFPVAFS